jgi:muramoyltetrapeptide carboxypeptidase
MGAGSLDRRLFLKLGGVMAMSTVMAGCSTLEAPPQAQAPMPRLRLMALGGPMSDEVRVGRGLRYLESMGFALENRQCVSRRAGRFAGDDAERLADLNALADPAQNMPELLLATRGGYGAARLLRQIDYARLCRRLKQHGTIVMGYSDNTAVQLALLAQGGVVSFSGPMLYGDFAAEPPSRFMLEQLRQVLTRPDFSLQIDAPRPDGMEIEGMLWGGNLSVLSGLIGSPYLPQTRGGILFIEDVGEDAYRIERMLLQLQLSGVLERQSAVLLGQFTDYRPDNYDAEGYSMERMLADFARRLPIPLLTGLPVGHVADILPLPIGAHARLVATASGYRLELSGYPTLKRLPAAFL